MSTNTGLVGFPLPAPDYGFNREFPESKLVATKTLLDMGGEADRNAVVARLESNKATVIITGGAVAEMEERLPGGIIYVHEDGKAHKDNVTPIVDWGFDPNNKYKGAKKGLMWKVAS